MAADPLNSVGGYTVGIPPVPVISSTGDVTTGNATIGYLSGTDANFSANVTANAFYGSFIGNIQGNITIAAPEMAVIYVSGGAAVGSSNFTYSSTSQTLNVVGTVMTDTFVMGTGVNQFSFSKVMFASTASAAANQVLHTQPASNICSVDYTVIATDSTANTRQTSKLFASVLGTEVGYFEYGTIDVPAASPGVGDFRVVYDSGNVNLTVTPVTSHPTTYKIMITSYKQ